MPDAISGPAETSRSAGPHSGQPASYWVRYERPLIGLTAVGAILGLWEVVCRSGMIKPIFLSAPSQIGATAVRMFASGELVEHLRVSGAEFLMGYALALTAIPMPDRLNSQAREALEDLRNRRNDWSPEFVQKERSALILANSAPLPEKYGDAARDSLKS